MGLEREIVLSVHQYDHLHIVECVEDKAKREDQHVVPKQEYWYCSSVWVLTTDVQHQEVYGDKNCLHYTEKDHESACNVVILRFLFSIVLLINLKLFQLIFTLKVHEAGEKLNIQDDVAYEGDEEDNLDLQGRDSEDVQYVYRTKAWRFLALWEISNSHVYQVKYEEVECEAIQAKGYLRDDSLAILDAANQKDIVYDCEKYKSKVNWSSVVVEEVWIWQVCKSIWTRF